MDLVRLTDIEYYLELQRKMEEIFQYISCTKDNYNTYSIKIENLFVVSCAFFDSLCRSIIVEKHNSNHRFKKEDEIQDFDKKLEYEDNKYFNIKDYRILLDGEYRLSSKSLNFISYLRQKYISPEKFSFPGEIGAEKITPLKEWSEGRSPGWWDAYTSLKHNRLANMNQATLQNLLLSLGAVYLLIFFKNKEYICDVELFSRLDFYNTFIPAFLNMKGRRSDGIPVWECP